jgi:hypothetical protein
LIALAAVLVALVGMPRGSEAAIDSEEQAVLTVINNYRQANGLGSLSLNGELNAAADWMSNDMAANDRFSHTDSLGRDPFQRMADFGYGYNTWKGENLVAGVDAAGRVRFVEGLAGAQRQHAEPKLQSDRHRPRLWGWHYLRLVLDDGIRRPGVAAASSGAAVPAACAGAAAAPAADA